MITTQDVTKSKFSDIVKQVSQFDNSDRDWIPLRIAFLRNITIDPIVPYLKFYCYQEGIKADIYMGDYDNIIQDAADGNSSLYQHHPDIIALCIRTRYQVDTDKGTDRIRSNTGAILDTIREHSNATILLHNFETPVYPGSGILSYQNRDGQVSIFREANSALLDVVSEYDNAYIVDIDLLQSVIGYHNFIDNRYWHTAKMPYTREAFILIAREYMKFIRALKGKTSKCLVLDCDNTLWGGIIGEDGLNKIEIGTTYPGSAFQEFQQAVMGLYGRGILLAICSKNNEQDVMVVLEKHPDMVLRREHFATIRINWNDKMSNLREIADELNIGLDSMVMVDDSEFELNMVKQLLPEVKTIHLPGDPSSYADILNSCGLFDILTLSEEDSKRNEMYRAEAGRKRAKTEFQSMTLEDYYRYLEMEVIIRNVDEFSVPRVAQLTQKTNQFNLTTRRYTESEIKELADDKNSEVRYLRLSDRFGDSGIVGVAILRYQGGEALIDTFLLSCRVIGRGVESILLKDCIGKATLRGCEKLLGVYVPTNKNRQVEKFYDTIAFSPVELNSNESRYAFLLGRGSPSLPGYFKSVCIE